MVNKENIRKWVEALRSGEYTQGKNALRDGDKYCCLGVACDVYDSSRWDLLPNFQASDGDRELYHYGEPSMFGFLPLEVAAWLGFKTDEVATNPFVRTPDGEEAHLTGLNDSENYSFAQIADCIERTYLTN